MPGPYAAEFARSPLRQPLLFGRAFGPALAARGTHVALIDLDGAEVGCTTAEIVNLGGSAVEFVGDVCDPARMAEVMAAAAKAAGGGINALISNAGLNSDAYGRPVLEMGLEKVRRLFDVNVMGVIGCTLAALPFMDGRPNASIINISSAAAHLGGSAYGVSKLAVAGMTLTFGRELGSRGIRVNAISPGLILTDTIRAELPEISKARVKAMQMIDADGDEEDVVQAMLYLISPAARFITGETLRVTGGMGAGIWAVNSPEGFAPSVRDRCS